MDNQKALTLFDWERLLIGEGIPYSFLLEVLLRSIVMFMVILLVLRLMGKRGIRQLSIFELAIIISLGSAAGDPMFYEDVALIPAIAVFVIVMTLYKGITYLSGRFEKIEKIVEGKPVKLIEDGIIHYENFRNESLAYDELFSELRLKQVDHLGQVRAAYLETSGELSIFYFEDHDVKWGLPILPDLLDNTREEVDATKVYACKLCGFTQDTITGGPVCHHCGKSSWIMAKNNPRIT